MASSERAKAPSGERFIPEAMEDWLISAEHHARYRFASQVVSGRRVLDAGCGVGWGSAILLAAGASSVTGLDLSAEAIADARQRSPGITFVEGDLQSLPFGDGEFDLVTCFEAIEHVPAPLKALDQLCRVLKPGGLLFVSSPNPNVYPQGNPFHVHEFTPAELVAEVRQRLEHVSLWTQHAHIASTLRPADVREIESRVALLTPSGPDTAIYELVVGCQADIPQLLAMTTLVSTRQLDEMGNVAKALSDDRAAFTAQAEAVAAEREAYLVDNGRLAAALAELTAEVEGLTNDRDNVSALFREAEQENELLRARALDAGSNSGR